MNMFKKNGGFTLVELIVVIAILAILAGVAVPAYSGYIKKAQDAAILTDLDAIATAAQAANATAGSISKIEITAANTVKVTADKISDDFEDDIKIFYGNVATVTVTPGVEAADPYATITLTNALGLDGTSYEEGAYWTAADAWGDAAPTEPTTAPAGSGT